MNLLREVRRVKKKSMATRIRLLFTFSLMLIITTYAWRAIDKDGNFKSLEADVTAWDVSYYINEEENEILDETAIFTVDELYPGMPLREDVVHIYNLGTASSNITYDVISVKVFGEEVVDLLEDGDLTNGELETVLEEKEGKQVTTINIFTEDTKYPFKIGFSYDKTKLIGEYVDDTTTPLARAKCTFNLEWDYQLDAADGEISEGDIEARDILDTYFGKKAYTYYNDAEKDNNPQKAIEIKVKIKSTMIHPDDDPIFNQ